MTCAVDGCTEPMRALGFWQGALLVDAVVGVAVDLTPLVLSAGQVSAAARGADVPRRSGRDPGRAGAVMSAHADEVVRYCVAKRQADGTYLCRCGQRWDADLHPIGGWQA